MQNSIYKEDIVDENLGAISPFQKKILESYNLDKKIFGLRLKDHGTGKTFIFDRWSSTDGEENVYDYMKDKNLNMAALEKKYLEMNELNSIYDASKEGSGI